MQFKKVILLVSRVLGLTKHIVSLVAPYGKRSVSSLKNTYKTNREKLRSLHTKYIIKRRRNRGVALDKKLVANTLSTKLPRWKNICALHQVLSSRESKIFSAITILFVLSAVSLLYIGYREVTRVAPALGGEYREGIQGSPRFINPLYASANPVDTDATRLLFSSLFRTDSGGDIVQDLAEEVIISKDAKAYTIKLRKALFHDNAPLTADDVVFTLEAIKNKEFKSALRSLFAGVSIKKIDDATVTFQLDEPNPLFPTLLVFGILPKHLWNDIKPEEAQLAVLNIKPIGSGPYAFKSLSKDTDGYIRSITTQAHREYYGKNPSIQFVTFVFFPSQNEIIHALLAGEIDGTAFIGVETPIEIRRKANITLYKPETLQYTALFINVSRPITADKNVRIALRSSLDTAELLKTIMNDHALPVTGPIPPQLMEEATASIKTPDVDEAERLLNEGGWERGENGMRKKMIKAKNKKEQDREVALEINMVTIDDPKTQEAAERIKESWTTLGAQVNLEIIPKSSIGEILRPRNYDVLLYGQALAEDLDLLPFWHSREINFPGLNLSVFSSRETDVLLEAARKETDFEKKRPHYEELAKILNHEVPVIFLWSPKSSYAISKKIQGVLLGRIINPADRFATLGEWYIKSKRVLK